MVRVYFCLDKQYNISCLAIEAVRRMALAYGTMFGIKPPGDSGNSLEFRIPIIHLAKGRGGNLSHFFRLTSNTFFFKAATRLFIVFEVAFRVLLQNCLRL